MKRMIVTIALLATGCATTAPEAFERRKRKFDIGNYQPVEDQRTPGSLFSDGRSLLDDERPRAVGDVVVVRIDETDSALHDSRTQMSRKAEVDVGITGAVARLAPQVNMADLFGYSASSEHDGSGRLQRRGEVKAMLPVRVAEVLPNGDLYIEGTKVVMVGRKQRYLYVSGVVRPADIQSDGTVLSARIADADITYIVHGDEGIDQRGWLAKVMDYVWPF